ncbi:MAG: DUF5063 domain-containing protein [bacterium]|nr:DUF5063 domain-containing protein [bacterium]
MIEEFNSMVDTAREYCRTIENSGSDDNDWLTRVFSLLPRLHAAIAAQMKNDGEAFTPLEANLENRFEMFTELHRLLGERDAYWMEYDMLHEAEHKSGSLADDLTDIYCELKSGLNQLEQQNPDQVLDNWKHGYRLHWGRHLVDAERHLYELSTKNQLD